MIARRETDLRREDGVTLVIALVTMLLIAVMVTSMLGYTAATSRQSSLVRADQQAYALAEAGLNQAVAQLASHYYDAAQKPTNNTLVFAPSWFTGVGLKTSQQSPTATAACTSSSSCMAWALVSCTFSAPIAGCSSMAAAGVQQGVVVLRGTGTVPNPTGGSRPTRRAVTAAFDVTQPSQLVVPPQYWKEIYTGAPPSGGCDLSLGQGVSISAPLYVAGNLCLTSSATIGGSNVDLKVFGWTWLRNSSVIGTSSSTPARVNTAQIKGGCSDNNNQQPTMSSGCQVNKSGGSIWDRTPTTQHAPTAPTADALPTVDWSWAQASQNNSLPAPSCTDGRSLAAASFLLTPAYSYSCTSAVGSIAYTYGGGGSSLRVDGNVYFGGNLTIDTGNTLVTYSGLGSFFVAGSVTGNNNSFLCVKTAGGSCDFANATNASSSGYWDATKSVLLIQAQGAVSATNLRFQGGLYSATSISLTGGQGCTQGPLVTPNILTVGQQLNGSFPLFPLIEAGSLGTPPPPFNLAKEKGTGTF